MDAITDALLVASRLLVAISARSIASVDETLTIVQFRTLVSLSNEGPVNLDRHAHPNSRRELVVELTRSGRQVVRDVTAQRRHEIARVVEQMPRRDRHGLVRALTAFTTAGGEPAARLDVDERL